MKYYLHVLKNYFVISGRASRREYWMFILFNIIFATCTIIIDKIIGSRITIRTGFTLPYGYVYLTYVILLLIPGTTVSVRRLHDVGKSGWMILISFIPIIGAIWLIILYLKDGDFHENKYGKNPKNVFIPELNSESLQ